MKIWACSNRLKAVFLGTNPLKRATTSKQAVTDLFLGLPVVLGRGGAERIIEMTLNDQEKAKLDHSANAVKSVVNVLGYGSEA